jgi:hypothetical protein
VSPLKALFDLIYFYRKNYTYLADLEQDLRIDLDLLKSYTDNEKYLDLETLALSYGKKNCKHFFEILIRETR